MNGVHCQVSAMIRLASAESGLVHPQQRRDADDAEDRLKSPKLGLKNDLK